MPKDLDEYRLFSFSVIVTGVFPSQPSLRHQRKDNRVSRRESPKSDFVSAIEQQHHPADQTPNLGLCEKEYQQSDFLFLATPLAEKLVNRYAQISGFTKWQASRSAVRRTQEPEVSGSPPCPLKGSERTPETYTPAQNLVCRRQRKSKIFSKQS